MEADTDHITIELSGSLGKKKAELYLEGHKTGPTAYDNILVKGERVYKKAGRTYVFDPTLSIGTYSTRALPAIQ